MPFKVLDATAKGMGDRRKEKRRREQAREKERVRVTYWNKPARSVMGVESGWEVSVNMALADTVCCAAHSQVMSRPDAQATILY